jgi:DNA-directed RNA polymerase specialized sigma24 family protein
LPIKHLDDRKLVRRVTDAAKYHYYKAFLDKNFHKLSASARTIVMARYCYSYPIRKICVTFKVSSKTVVKVIRSFQAYDNTVSPISPAQAEWSSTRD